MRINKLVLKGYKRFDLLGSDKIVYEPQSPYQLILGKNGIGKSSLLNELSPLPVDRNDLKEEGYKEIYLSHRGHEYKLINKYGKSLTNHFIRDGEELNPGGTIKVQRQLVQEHFNYNDDIHNVLVGFTLLSNMSPQVRREWFVKMSRADMGYAVGVYKRIASAERDIKGAIKLNNSRMVTEQAKLPKQEVIDDSRRIQKELTHDINYLLPLTDKTLSNKAQELMMIEEEMRKVSSRIMELNLAKCPKEIKHPLEVNKLIDEIRYEKTSLNVQYKKTLDELTDLQDSFNKTKALTNRSIPEINKDIEDLSKKIADLKQVRESLDFEIGADPELELNSFYRVKEELNEVFNQMPVNDNDFSKANIEKLTEEVQSYKEKLIRLENAIKYDKDKLENIKGVNDVTCPKCDNTFKPGICNNKVHEIEKQIEVNIAIFNQLHGDYEKKFTALKENQHYFSFIRRLRDIRERYPEYSFLFKYLTGFTELMKTNPVGLTYKIVDYEKALKSQEGLNIMASKLKQLNEELERRIAVENNNLEHLTKAIEKLEKNLADITTKTNLLNEKLNQYQVIASNNELMLDAKERLEMLINDYRVSVLEQTKFKNNEVLNQIIASKQQELANHSVIVERYNQSLTIVEQLEKTNTELLNEQIALKVLMDLLSPTDGLIAESLIGFINQFLLQMTNVLEQIWSYSMRPFMGLTEDGIDLDYKFKVDVNDGDIIVKDVSCLSRGQKEIVDFVFKLILMQYLDLQDYPLFMDEVGGSFDSYHRDKLYHYIKQLVESNQVSQVFIISHIASSHDALSNADRVVLDTDGYMTEEDANKVISF